MHRVIDLVIGRKMLINVESTLSQRGEGVGKKSTVCTLVIMSIMMNVNLKLLSDFGGDQAGFKIKNLQFDTKQQLTV